MKITIYYINNLYEYVLIVNSAAYSVSIDLLTKSFTIKSYSKEGGLGEDYQTFVEILSVQTDDQVNTETMTKEVVEKGWTRSDSKS